MANSLDRHATMPPPVSCTVVAGPNPITPGEARRIWGITGEGAINYVNPVNYMYAINMSDMEIEPIIRFIPARGLCNGQMFHFPSDVDR